MVCTCAAWVFGYVCVCGLDLLCFACPMHTGRKWSNAAGGYCMVVQCTVVGWGLVSSSKKGGRVGGSDDSSYVVQCSSKVESLHTYTYFIAVRSRVVYWVGTGHFADQTKSNPIHKYAMLRVLYSLLSSALKFLSSSNSGWVGQSFRVKSRLNS